MASVKHPLELGDESGAPMGVLHCRKGGCPPLGGAHPRAVHNPVWVLRGGPSEACDHLPPLGEDPREVPVHVVLPTPPWVSPVSPEVSLNLDDRREVGFECHGEEFHNRWEAA